jgi:hypothetical protein
VWLAIICLGVFIALYFLSSSIGGRWAERDQGLEGHLPIVTIISAEPLWASGGALTPEGKWRYEQMRLIIKTEDTYYVFRPEEVRDGIVETHGIPQDRVVETQLYPWFEKIVHP